MRGEHGGGGVIGIVGATLRIRKKVLSLHSQHLTLLLVLEKHLLNSEEPKGTIMIVLSNCYQTDITVEVGSKGLISYWESITCDNGLRFQLAFVYLQMPDLVLCINNNGQ